MKSILDWLQHNKEWVFSGVGVTVVFGNARKPSFQFWTV
jgi:hypothetical protein